jgi:hypothetical protein
MGKQYNNGVTMKELRNSLYQSQEYIAAHPQPTPTADPESEAGKGY